MTPLEQSRCNLAQTVIKGLERRNMTGEYCATRDDAKAAIARFLIPGTSVAAGGSATLGVGESLELLDKNWDSRNLPVFTMSQNGIVSVSKKGKVKAVGKGTAVITVKTANGKKAKVKIKVK